MGYETINRENIGGIVRVTLNRPQQLNALSSQLMKELDAVMSEIEQEESQKVLLITGASRPDGRPCFSAGADLKEVAKLGAGRPDAMIGINLAADERLLLSIKDFVFAKDSLPQLLFNRLEKVSKPTIAAIDGICCAGGFELALCCDFRLVCETANIFDTHMKNLNGALGGGGISVRLPRVVGPSKAKELLWSQDHIDGREALRIGLANQVFPKEGFDESCIAFARRLVDCPPFGIKLSKMLIDGGLDLSNEQALRFSEFLSNVRVYMRPDIGANAAKAFADKKRT